MNTVAIVLGYALNLDGSMDDILVKRLNLLLKLNKEMKLDHIIVTGGRPNEKILVSEASQMAKYLIENGIDESKIIKEEKAGSTFGNAKFSIPIAKELKAERIIIVTTIEHFTNYDYNPLKIFSEFIDDENINMMIYTNTVPTL